MKAALATEYSPDNLRQRCRRRSRVRFRCTVAWHDGDRFDGTVEVWRSGTFGSPTTGYRGLIRKREQPLFCTERCPTKTTRQRLSGSLKTPVRRAYLGQPLVLPDDEGAVTVTARPGQDPAPAGRYAELPANTRYVTFAFEVVNRTRDVVQIDISISDDATLVLGDRTTLQGNGSAEGCEDEATVPPEETRLVCVTFTVPNGAPAAALELQVDDLDLAQWRFVRP